MKNKIIIPTVLFAFVLIFSFYVLSQEKNKTEIVTNESIKKVPTTPESSNQLIFFYGDKCPHCAIVEKYFKENKIEEKIQFSQKEVYSNKNNAKELEAKAKACGISTDSIGVPFLWDGEKCLIGDEDIINFFEQKTNEQ